MKSILHKYGQDNIKERFLNGTLRGLPGVGPTKEQLISDYFIKKNRLVTNEKRAIQLVRDCFDCNYANWKEEFNIYFVKGPTEAQCLFIENLQWMKENCSPLYSNAKKKIALKWLEGIFPPLKKKEEKNMNNDNWEQRWIRCHYKPNDITSNPMLLNKITTSNSPKIDDWALLCKLWTLKSQLRWKSYIEYVF